MARGVGYTKHLDDTLKKSIYETQVPSMAFLYETSTTINPEYSIGDRVVLPDGRVFRYCKSSGQCDTYIANVFVNAIPATGIDYSLLAAASASGTSEVTMTNQGTVAQTLDGLRGGNINFGVDNNLVQQRGIVGNTAGGASDEITIYLDAPLVTSLTTSDYAYCMPSPYSNVIGAQQHQTGKVGFVGYAAAGVTAADVYHWEQTWGLMPSASLYGSEVGKTQHHRDVYFRYDGNLMHRTAGAGDLGQRAGFIVDNNDADNGATMIMLQVSP